MSALGVALFVSAYLSPESLYPVTQFFSGVALMAVAHVLTPCRDQVTKWWQERFFTLRKAK